MAMQVTGPNPSDVLDLSSGANDENLSRERHGRIGGHFFFQREVTNSNFV
jgi:hypothetical protein